MSRGIKTTDLQAILSLSGRYVLLEKVRSTFNPRCRVSCPHEEYGTLIECESTSSMTKAL
jgi:hypothetical protein